MLYSPTIHASLNDDLDRSGLTGEDDEDEFDTDEDEENFAVNKAYSPQNLVVTTPRGQNNGGKGGKFASSDFHCYGGTRGESPSGKVLYI